MMNNLGLRQARKQILDFLNGLPYDIEVKRLLLKDIYGDICEIADKVVLKESTEAQEALKKAKEESNGTGMATTTDINVDK